MTAPFEGLQGSPQSPEDHFGIVRIAPVRPQCPKTLPLQVEPFARVGNAPVQAHEIVVGERHRGHVGTTDGLRLCKIARSMGIPNVRRRPGDAEGRRDCPNRLEFHGKQAPVAGEPRMPLGDDLRRLSG